ncbi:MAG: DUF115 domain-containing protein [Treponema sp.]|jgi:hypothetical protein|nr:DUF115 domain-containing protein [Treponema sp.]
MEGGFSYKGKTLLSRVDPAGKADRVADTVPVIDGTLYLCPSPLYGYGLERLLSRLELTPNSAVLCFEAEPELFAISREHFSDELKRNCQLGLTETCEPAELCALIRKKWGSRVFHRVHILRLNGGWQLYPDLNSLADTLQREIALDWGNAMTLTRLGRLYIRNMIRNLALIPQHPSIDSLSFGAEPVLALGAGPSLDAALDALVSRFGEAALLSETRPFRIVCVDTCLPALRERCLRPDLVIILESQHWNLDDFIGLSGWGLSAAFDLSALPRSARVLGDRLFLFFTPWTRLNIFKRLSDLLPLGFVPLGSVGLSAVAISMRLTQGTVITAGIDFSFNLDSYHARSTPGHLAKLRRQSRFKGLLNADVAFGQSVFKTLSNNGASVLSNPGMKHYRDLFEKQFGGCSSRLFDIAGSGLPLGIKTLSMEDAFIALTSNDNVVNGENTMKTLLAKENLNSLTNNSKMVNEKQIPDFIHKEIDRLLVLRDILTGSSPMDYGVLANLIDECDYLWAHFPDYAASSRRPTKAELEAGSAISFLKRLRVEIEPFIKLWKLTETLL